MNAAPVEQCAWSRRRWGGAIMLAAIIQVALIFWLGDRRPTHVRRLVASPPTYLMAEKSAELMALSDPTLFALANRHGFSGAAWLAIPSLTPQSADWTEPPRWLPLSVRKLGEVFNQLIQTNTQSPLAEKVEPEVRVAEFVPVDSSMPRQSTLRIEGDLAERSLLSAVELPSWSHPDVLADSVVQVIVDPDGYTASATLLSSSGLKEADARALELARSARFRSVRGRGPERLASTVERLNWGKLIFQWHTTAPLATNAPLTSP